MERIVLVNKDDEPIGSKFRSEIGADDIGRSSALWVTDADGNILLVRRSNTVKFYPGLLSYAVTGAVGENETYEQAIVREMEEELGITGFSPDVSIKYLATGLGRSWFMQVFRITLPRDYVLKPDLKEVGELKWFSRDELIEHHSKNPDEFVRGFGEETKLFLNL